MNGPSPGSPPSAGELRVGAFNGELFDISRCPLLDRDDLVVRRAMQQKMEFRTRELQALVAECQRKEDEVQLRMDAFHEQGLRVQRTAEGLAAMICRPRNRS